jgi:hypothetical protein
MSEPIAKVGMRPHAPRRVHPRGNPAGAEPAGGARRRDSRGARDPVRPDQRQGALSPEMALHCDDGDSAAGMVPGAHVAALKDVFGVAVHLAHRLHRSMVTS